MSNESVQVINGNLHRTGNVIRAVWDRDVLGRPLNNPVETWTCETEQQAQEQFQIMQERFNESRQ